MFPEHETITLADAIVDHLIEEIPDEVHANPTHAALMQRSADVRCRNRQRIEWRSPILDHRFKNVIEHPQADMNLVLQPYLGMRIS